MPKKKEPAPKNLCPHCTKEFPVAVRWCTKCEDHMGSDSWLLGKDVCDRCHTGDNDYYLKRKKGRDKRIAAALEKQKDPKNWCDCGVVEAYEKWVASEQYIRRFDTPSLMGMKVIVTEAAPPYQAALVSEIGEGNERKLHAVGVRTGTPEVFVDLSESGAWPPNEILERVFGQTIR